MKLRGKLLLALVMIMVIIYGFIHYMWMPSFLKYETEQQIEQTQQKMALLAHALVADMLSNDLARLYGTMNKVKRSHSNWYELNLLDHDGRRLYPLKKMIKPVGITTEYLRVDVIHKDKHLGTLQLYVDIQASLLGQVRYLDKLKWLLLMLVVFVAVIAYVIQERWIIRPLRGLSVYARAIAEGDYARQPKYCSKDEIGDLVDVIRFMGQEVEYREKRLAIAREVDELTLFIQSEFISDQAKGDIFGDVLEKIIRLTWSEFGIIGEVLYESDETPYLKSFADKNIIGNEEPSKLYDQSKSNKLNSLFAEVIRTRKIVVVNVFDDDMSGGEILDGYLPINSFLGMPIFSGKDMVGMLGLVNWQGDYRELISFEKGQNLLAALGSMIVACRNRETILESEARFRTVVDATVDGIITIDIQGNIKIFNLASERIFGFRAEEVIGQNVGVLMPEFMGAQHDIYIQRHISTNQSRVIGREREVQGRHKDGTLFPLELAIAKVETTTGLEFTGIVRDISERVLYQKQLKEANAKLEQANQELDKLARKDALTGLYNRRHFDEAIQNELQRCARKSQNISLIFADVDFFKDYNDYYGHQAGDDCLKIIAHSMNESFSRAGDVVARYGGEEFAIIVPELQASAAFDMADKMRQAVARCAIPHKKSSAADVVTLSVGLVTLIPDKQTKASLLVELADQALYLAKSKGRDNVQCQNMRQDKQTSIINNSGQ